MTHGSEKYQTTIIVPVLNEASTIQSLLKRLLGYDSNQCQILLVDGGSEDSTVNICRKHGCDVISSTAGRATQMNSGARQSGSQILWFLHADCLPPGNAMDCIHESIHSGAVWGRFDVRLSGQAWMFRVIENMMNWRSCLTGVATGDQGIFMTRSAFDQVNGFPEIPLMEDVAISKRLCRLAKPACVKERILVSSRRWEDKGIARTIILMWWLRLQYYFGVAPARLHAAYYGKKN